MSAMTHFPIWHYWYTPSVWIRYASTTTRYPPPSNCAIDNRRVSMAVFARPYRPLHVRWGPGTPASTHSSRCYLKLVKRCKNHPFEDLPVVPGLRLDRNILRRRMKGRQSDPLRLRRHNVRRATGCLRGSRSMRELLSRRARFLGRMLLKNWLNWSVILSC